MIGQGLAPSPYREAITLAVTLDVKLMEANAKITELTRRVETLTAILERNEDDNK